MSQDLFDLFNIAVEEEKKEITVKATQKAKDTKKNNEKAKENKKKAVDELDGMNIETVLRFHTINHSILDYFAEEEVNQGITVMDEKEGKEKINKISKEDIRLKMERDYPELTKELTNMVFVKEKNMIVVMNAAGKKGLPAAPQKSAPKESAVFWHNDLLYIRDINTPVKIPHKFLMKFINLARGVAATHGTEVHADIYYDPEKKDFHFHVPPQVATIFAVQPLPLPEEDIDRWLYLSNMIKVLEIHSHHTMRAIPSKTDDANERKPIYFCIVGRVQDFFPEIYTRTYDVVNQRYVKLEPFQVFETPVELPQQYPQISFEKECHE